jgi:hypothetical protein
VDARGLHAARSQQGLERELDDLLRLAHHVGPALAVEQDVEGGEAHARALEVVEREIEVAHQRGAVQYGCPWARRRVIVPAAMSRRTWPRMRERRAVSVEHHDAVERGFEPERSRLAVAGGRETMWTSTAWPSCSSGSRSHSRYVARVTRRVGSRTTRTSMSEAAVASPRAQEP